MRTRLILAGALGGLIAALALSAHANNAASITPEENGLPLSGGTVSGNVTVTGDTGLQGATINGTLVGSCPTTNNGHGYILDINGIQGCYLTSSIAPTVLVIHPEDNFATGAQTAAPLALRGGIDEKNVTMTRANCSGKTFTVVTKDPSNTSTSTTFTEDGVGGTSVTWNRGATDATAATNLAAKINALHGTAGVSATAASNVISIIPDKEMMNIVISTNDGTCAAINSPSSDASINAFSTIAIASGSSTSLTTLGNINVNSNAVVLTSGGNITNTGTIGSTGAVSSGSFTLPTTTCNNGALFTNGSGVAACQIGFSNAGNVPLVANTTTLAFSGTSSHAWFYGNTTNDEFKLAVGSSNGEALDIIDTANYTDDCTSADASTPTLRVHSATRCNTTKTKDVAIWHDDTDGNVQAETGNLKLASQSGSGITINAGAAIKKHLSATASLDFGATSAHTCDDLTLTVTGAADGDTVAIGVPNALATTDAQTVITGFVSAADTCKVRRCCNSASACSNPAAATIRCDVWQH